MQRNEKSALVVGDYVVTKQKVPGRGEMLTDAQIVAATGDKLSVVTVGERDARSVSRSDVQSYQEVYGIPAPGNGAQPIVNQIRK